MCQGCYKVLSLFNMQTGKFVSDSVEDQTEQVCCYIRTLLALWNSFFLKIMFSSPNKVANMYSFIVCDTIMLVEA